MESRLSVRQMQALALNTGRFLRPAYSPARKLQRRQIIVARWRSKGRGPPVDPLTKLHDKTTVAVHNLDKVYSDLKTLCHEGSAEDALSILRFMGYRRAIPADIKIYVTLLKFCIVRRNFRAAKQVHRHMRLTGANKIPRLALLLVQFYALYGNVDEALEAFSQSSQKTQVLWHAVIRAYVRNGSRESLKLYDEMISSGFRANAYTFSTVFKACGDQQRLRKGRQIHGLAIKMGFEMHRVVAGAVVNFYSRCRRVEESCQVFEEYRDSETRIKEVCADAQNVEKNTNDDGVVLWTAMIEGLVRNGCFREALCRLKEMIQEDCRPDLVTLVSALPACEAFRAVQQGRQIHAYAIRHGFERSKILQKALLSLYWQSYRVEFASELFKQMATENAAAWKANSSGYASEDAVHQAFEMIGQTIADRSVAITVDALQLCTTMREIYRGKQIHAYAIKHGFAGLLLVCCGLYSMYRECSAMNESCKLLSSSSDDVILGYAGNYFED